MWGSDPLFLGGNLCNYDMLQLWVANFEVWVLIVLHLHPSYTSCCGFFFIFLVVEKSFLLVFRSFSSIVVI